MSDVRYLHLSSTLNVSINSSSSGVWQSEALPINGEQWVATTDLAPSAGEQRSTVREYSIPLLKSGLQKAVRRRKEHAAVCLLLQLLLQKGGALEVLRRLPIICIEDSVPHPLICLSLWCMLACSKGYDLPIEVIKGLLEGTWEITKIEKRLCVRTKDHIEDKSADLMTACITMRRAYGGMQGDMKMLESYEKADLSACRWMYSSEHEPMNLTEKDLINYVLPESSKLLEGVDFHCFRFLLPKVSSRCVEMGFPFATENYVSHLWWSFRSGVYKEKLLVDLNGAAVAPSPPGEDEPYWGLIEPIVNEVIAEVDPWGMSPVERPKLPGSQPQGAAKTQKRKADKQPTIADYLAKKAKAVSC
eukprot:TRINITY_DN12240_c0_g1_i1.p1 TRINITY_DN12240_c0_g1~~TRINITY_DN12240_c0_g1_i1.p1  ORF type:complete len:360 (+),score=58.81 TRINITY_DN12240_c0_g1_i1:196-1275(+)